MSLFSSELQAYLDLHTTEEPPLLQQLRRETHLKVLYPQMLSSPGQGYLLTLFSRLLKPQRVLEVGTFTGYGTLCLAKGLAEGGKVISMEADEEKEDLIRKYLKLGGVEKQVTLLIGDAKELIPELEGPFDLAFIDADKASYPRYYELIMPRLKPGGMLLADNVLWSGKVLSAARTKETRGIQEFNERVRKDPQAESLLLPQGDGIYLVRKR
jgi:caffeoyl-CoA O-methyltransferase